MRGIKDLKNAWMTSQNNENLFYFWPGLAYLGLEILTQCSESLKPVKTNVSADTTLSMAL